MDVYSYSDQHSKLAILYSPVPSILSLMASLHRYILLWLSVAAVCTFATEGKLYFSMLKSGRSGRVA